MTDETLETLDLSLQVTGFVLAMSTRMQSRRVEDSESNVAILNQCIRLGYVKKTNDGDGNFGHATRLEGPLNYQFVSYKLTPKGLELAERMRKVLISDGIMSRDWMRG